MRRLHLLDASAQVALFEGHALIVTLVERAWAGSVLVGFPAAAVAEANAVVDGDYELWRQWMVDPSLVGLPLTVHIAADVAGWPGPLGARHCVYEARATNGAVVTRKPGEYEGLQVPLLVV